MEVDYVRSFLIASCAVLKSAANIEVDIENTYIKSFTPNEDQVLFCAPIQGKYRGRAIVSMSKGTACTIASGMLKRSAVSELDELARSAISEMANMILGNTMTVFSLAGNGVDMASSGFAGYWDLSESGPGQETLCIPLKAASEEEMEINLALWGGQGYDSLLRP